MPGGTEEIMLASAAKASAENFPVAMRILPARYRRHLMALYGFARLTDDIGDEITPAARSRLLDELEADVARIYGGGPPRLAALRELAVTAAECGIPAQPLLDLIQANRQDQIVTRYETAADLAGYCRCPLTRWASWCCTSSVRHPLSASGSPIASALLFSLWSTGRTWRRTSARAGSTCRGRTWSSSA